MVMAARFGCWCPILCSALSGRKIAVRRAGWTRPYPPKRHSPLVGQPFLSVCPTLCSSRQNALFPQERPVAHAFPAFHGNFTSPDTPVKFRLALLTIQLPNPKLERSAWTAWLVQGVRSWGLSTDKECPMRLRRSLYG